MLIILRLMLLSCPQSTAASMTHRRNPKGVIHTTIPPDQPFGFLLQSQSPTLPLFPLTPVRSLSAYQMPSSGNKIVKQCLSSQLTSLHERTSHQTHTIHLLLLKPRRFTPGSSLSQNSPSHSPRLLPFFQDPSSSSSSSSCRATKDAYPSFKSCPLPQNVTPCLRDLPLPSLAPPSQGSALSTAPPTATPIPRRSSPGPAHSYASPRPHYL